MMKLIDVSTDMPRLQPTTNKLPWRLLSGSRCLYRGGGGMHRPGYCAPQYSLQELQLVDLEPRIHYQDYQGRLHHGEAKEVGVEPA